MIKRNSELYLDKERVLELTHFCRQYYTFKQRYDELDNMNSSSLIIISKDSSEDAKEKARDRILEKKMRYGDLIRMIEFSAYRLGPEYCYYILEAVTKGKDYSWMRMYKDIPFCRNTFYEKRRLFFYFLDKARK